MKNAEHPSCKSCPLSIKGMAFGVSCTKHNIDWQNNDKTPLFMGAGSDPGGTTPEKTGILCAFCNSANATDKTAQHTFDLLKTAIIGDWKYNLKEGHHFFKQFYSTNIVKHGIPTKGNLSDSEIRNLKSQFDFSRRCCKGVFLDELNLFKPKLLTLSGKNSVMTLQELKILPSGSFMTMVENSPYKIRSYYSDGSDLLIWCLYHTAAKVTNMTLPRYYSDSILEEINVIKKNHPNPEAVDSFIQKYNRESDTVRKGMMVHLKSWLKMGQLMRELVSLQQKEM